MNIIRFILFKQLGLLVAALKSSDFMKHKSVRCPQTIFKILATIIVSFAARHVPQTI